MISGFAAFLTFLPALAGFCAIGLSIFWLFNKKARRRQLAELRKRYEEMSPTDPEYNDVRALYFSMMLDGQREDFHHSHAAAHEHSGSFSDGGHHHSGAGGDGDGSGADAGGGDGSGSGGDVGGGGHD